MLNTRAGGVLMHITSLPSKYGIGVMGEETKRFIRRIKDMGFSYWQVLPLCPTDFTAHLMRLRRHLRCHRF